MHNWLYPDALRSLSPWLRWSVAALVGACTGFMLIHSYPWPVLLYIDSVLFGFGWAVVFHIAADRHRTAMSGAPALLRPSGKLDVGHGVAVSRQLARRGWQLFGASLLVGLVGISVLVLGLAGT